MTEEQTKTLNWWIENITGLHRCEEQQVTDEELMMLKAGSYKIPGVEGPESIVNFGLPEGALEGL